MFIAIPDSNLVTIAHTLKAEGFVLAPKCDVRGNIVRVAERDFPRTDGNHWRFPKGYTLKSVFYPAFNAADSPIVTAKATKATKASGKRVAGSPEAIAWGKAMAEARAAKRNGGQGYRQGREDRSQGYRASGVR